MARIDEEVSKRLTKRGFGTGTPRAGSDNSTVALVQNLLGAENISDFLNKRASGKIKRKEGAEARERLRQAVNPTPAERVENQRNRALTKRDQDTKESTFTRPDGTIGRKFTIRGKDSLVERLTKASVGQQIKGGDLTNLFNKANIDKTQAETREINASTKSLQGFRDIGKVSSLPDALNPLQSSGDKSRIPGASPFNSPTGKGSTFQNNTLGVSPKSGSSNLPPGLSGLSPQSLVLMQQTADGVRRREESQQALKKLRESRKKLGFVTR